MSSNVSSFIEDESGGFGEKEFWSESEIYKGDVGDFDLFSVVSGSPLHNTVVPETCLTDSEILESPLCYVIPDTQSPETMTSFLDCVVPDTQSPESGLDFYLDGPVDVPELSPKFKAFINELLCMFCPSLRDCMALNHPKLLTLVSGEHGG